jgi:hypothetical protein
MQEEILVSLNKMAATSRIAYKRLFRAGVDTAPFLVGFLYSNKNYQTLKFPRKRRVTKQAPTSQKCHYRT